MIELVKTEGEVEVETLVWDLVVDVEDRRRTTDPAAAMMIITITMTTATDLAIAVLFFTFLSNSLPLITGNLSILLTTEVQSQVGIALDATKTD